jgi:para-aminobenzoate synthetase component 1
MQYDTAHFITRMNRWGREGRPFLFLLDYALYEPLVLALDEINPQQLLFDVNGVRNFSGVPEEDENTPVSFSVFPVSRERYCKAFSLVQQHIRRGDSFLLNLTFPSRIETNLRLKQLFFRSRARYKLWLKDRFVCFSPEIFVQTDGKRIRSFPMKGTLDARIENAREKLLSNKKELAEHFTIVDLIRNDLSQVAYDVQVSRFRYIDRIKTNRNEILQMSSEISGVLRPAFRRAPGDLLYKILPAGSISGAPKKKTLEIIRRAEDYDRGFYTGVFGIFDGKTIDSGVMIRFIEKTDEGLVYKSGGGITAQSRCQEEYDELIEKIYVPFT